jgi:Primase X
VWCILACYLINIRKCSADEASKIVKDWLDRCNQLRRLGFAYPVIKYNTDSAKKNGYLPISLEKLKSENTNLYNVLAKS